MERVCDKVVLYPYSGASIYLTGKPARYTVVCMTTIQTFCGTGAKIFVQYAQKLSLGNY